MKQAIRNYFIMGAFAGIIGFAGGEVLGDLYFAEPVKAYVRDVNNDGRPDIVIKSREGAPTIFMQEVNGTYIVLNEFINSKKRAAANNSKLEIKAIEKEERSLEVEGLLTR